MRRHVDYSRLCVWVEAALLSPTGEHDVVMQRQENSLSSFSSLHPILFLCFFSSPHLGLLFLLSVADGARWSRVVP